MRQEVRRGNSRVRRVVIAVAWLVGMLMGVASWLAAEAATADRLALRVASGVPAAAEVVEVEQIGWYSLLFRDAMGTYRAGVQYAAAGTTYRSQVTWAGPADNRQPEVGDTITVYFDEERPSKIATAEGAGSDEWAILGPRLLLAGWLLILTVGCLAALRVERPRPAARETSYAVTLPVAGSQVEAASGVDFGTVLLGYKRADVDSVLGAALAAAESGDGRVRAGAASSLQAAKLRVALRGYDREQVDYVIDRALDRLRRHR